jgi:hypothetical protein
MALYTTAKILVLGATLAALPKVCDTGCATTYLSDANAVEIRQELDEAQTDYKTRTLENLLKDK